MRYEKIVEAVFLDRPNRFIAKVLVEEDGKTIEKKVHVKNTGRCKELLTKGTKVYLEDFEGRMGTRKMRYSLIAVKKESERGTLIINLDSQAPNKVAYEGLRSGKIWVEGMGRLTEIKAERTFGNSRLDFYVKDQDGKEGFIEVKGVTLEADGVARFPDAPTQRGTKHIEHLVLAKNAGYYTMILFVVQMKGIGYMEPNWETDSRFAEALVAAHEGGVDIKAFDCLVGSDAMTIDIQLPVHLEKDTGKYNL